jgi:hypothetical protein
MSEWEPLRMDPRTLLDARLQLHWAAQVAAAVGKQLLPHQPDFSEQSCEWQAGPRVLAQGLVAGAQPFRPAIRPSPPALLLLGPADETLRELPLAGHTLEEAYDWMRREVEALLGRPLAEPLARSEGLPAHPVATGAPFAFPDAPPEVNAPAEMARYFADAYLLLRDLMAREDSSHVRCWPHHFDIAILIQLDDDGSLPADPEHARSIGVGLSPGDDAIPRPYFYLLPWPRPARSPQDLPALDGGGWHTEGWLGAVLDSTEFAATENQQQRCERFLTSAVAACRELLEEPQ